MERKSRRAYEHVFQLLKEATRTRVRRELAPVKVSTDYEQSAIQAVRAAFPGAQTIRKIVQLNSQKRVLHVRLDAADAEVAGCLFHFGQAQWRRLQDSGLAVAYRREENEPKENSDVDSTWIPRGDVEVPWTWMNPLSFHHFHHLKIL